MMHHEGTKGTKARALCVSHRVIGAAIEVHRHLGPGLLESIYESALARELWLRGVDVRRQVPLQISYKGSLIESRVRMDLVIGRVVVVEVKSVDKVVPVHHAQLLTYLKLSHLPLGLLINFNSQLLRLGIRRILNG